MSRGTRPDSGSIRRQRPSGLPAAPGREARTPTGKGPDAAPSLPCVGRRGSRRGRGARRRLPRKESRLNLGVGAPLPPPQGRGDPGILPRQRHRPGRHEAGAERRARRHAGGARARAAALRPRAERPAFRRCPCASWREDPVCSSGRRFVPEPYC